jgi:tetratricopeptide (TPR) repeat protein
MEGVVAQKIDMGKAFLRTNMLEKAEECFETIVDDGERAHEAHFYLGVIAFKKKEFEKAAEHFKRLLEIRTDSVHAYNNLALSLEKLGRAKEAMLVYNTGLEMSPSSSLLLANRGVLRCKTADWEGAVRDLSKALKRRPGVRFLLFYLSLAFAKLGRLPEAKDRLLEALDGGSEDPAILTNLGYICMELGCPDDARRYLSAAVRSSSSPAAAFQGLAALHARRGDLDMAFLMARKASAGDDAKTAHLLERIAADLVHEGRKPEAEYLLGYADELTRTTAQPGQESQPFEEHAEDSHT